MEQQVQEQEIHQIKLKFDEGDLKSVDLNELWMSTKPFNVGIEHLKDCCCIHYKKVDQVIQNRTVGILKSVVKQMLIEAKGPLPLTKQVNEYFIWDKKNEQFYPVMRIILIHVGGSYSFEAYADALWGEKQQFQIKGLFFMIEGQELEMSSFEIQSGVFVSRQSLIDTYMALHM